MIQKILKKINSAIDFIQKFIWIITIVLGITSFAGFNGCSKQKKSKQNYITIAKDEVRQKETLSGNHAIEKTQWILSWKQLQEEISQEQAKSSEFLSQIKKMQDYSKDLEIENKRLKTYNNTLIESSDSVRTELVFIDCKNIKIEPIEREHINITFDQSGDYLDVYYKYNAEVTTIVHMVKDKDQFFLWRWIKPRWIDKSVTTINDPNAKINNNVNVEFKRK